LSPTTGHALPSQSLQQGPGVSGGNGFLFCRHDQFSLWPPGGSIIVLSIDGILNAGWSARWSKWCLTRSSMSTIYYQASMKSKMPNSYIRLRSLKTIPPSSLVRNAGSASSRTWSSLKRWPRTTTTASPKRKPRLLRPRDVVCFLFRFFVCTLPPSSLDHQHTHRNLLTSVMFFILYLLLALYLPTSPLHGPTAERAEAGLASRYRRLSQPIACAYMWGRARTEIKCASFFCLYIPVCVWCSLL